VVAFSATGCGQATCSPLASYPLDAGTTAVAKAAVYDNGRIFVATTDGQLIAFRASGQLTRRPHPA
jgi:outer membrane protein assembly factor BamB